MKRIRIRNTVLICNVSKSNSHKIESGSVPDLKDICQLFTTTLIIMGIISCLFKNPFNCLSCFVFSSCIGAFCLTCSYRCSTPPGAWWCAPIYRPEQWTRQLRTFWTAKLLSRFTLFNRRFVVCMYLIGLIILSGSFPKLGTRKESI